MNRYLLKALEILVSRGFVVLAFVSIPAFAAPAFGQVSPLAPHQALYVLKNADLSQRSGIVAITGLMSVGFAGAACEGYTSDARIALNIQRRGGKRVVSDLNSSSWEQGDGRSFRFNSQQKLNNRVSEATSGRAELDDKTQAGEGQMLKPRPAKFTLPKSVIFPTEYTKRVIAAAKSGKKIYQALIFDGTDGDKTVSSLALIGKLKPPGTLKPPFKIKAQETLSKLPAWPVEVSYYALDDRRSEQTPTYRVNLLLYENGVATDMRMQYSDFTLKTELKSLEIKKPPQC